jgi:hypothetical protein
MTELICKNGSVLAYSASQSRRAGLTPVLRRVDQICAYHLPLVNCRRRFLLQRLVRFDDGSLIAPLSHRITARFPRVRRRHLTQLPSEMRWLVIPAIYPARSGGRRDLSFILLCWSDPFWTLRSPADRLRAGSLPDRRGLEWVPSTRGDRQGGTGSPPDA